MPQTTEAITWLTQEAYDRLKAELEYMSGVGRHELAARIEAAREEGDLRENGGYHAAKEEQGKQEARIRQLEPAAGRRPGRRGAAGRRRRRARDAGHRAVPRRRRVDVRARFP